MSTLSVADLREIRAAMKEAAEWTPAPGMSKPVRREVIDVEKADRLVSVLRRRGYVITKTDS